MPSIYERAITFGRNKFLQAKRLGGDDLFWEISDGAYFRNWLINLTFQWMVAVSRGHTHIWALHKVSDLLTRIKNLSKRSGFDYQSMRMLCFAWVGNLDGAEKDANELSRKFKPPKYSPLDDVLWTKALIAMSRGDGEDELQKAIAANPHILEKLVSRTPVEPDLTTDSTGKMTANRYVFLSGGAWYREEKLMRKLEAVYGNRRPQI